MAVFGMTTEKSKNSASENFFQFFSFSRDLNLHIGDRYVEYPVKLMLALTRRAG